MKHQPKTKEELEQLIVDCYHGKLYLQDIDTSLVTNMSDMFNYWYYKDKYGIYIDDIWKDKRNDISQWDVSSVTRMYKMFFNNTFNGDISKWNVSNVIDMSYMFSESEFNQDISKWDVSNVEFMGSVFKGSKFNQDISLWNVSNVADMSGMFYMSKFNQDISSWDVKSVIDMNHMFYNSEFNQDLSLWILRIDHNTIMGWFNENSKHSKTYGGINSYDDFIQTINWNNIKEYIKNIMKNSSDKERYELLKRLNNIKHISNIDLDISI